MVSHPLLKETQSHPEINTSEHRLLFFFFLRLLLPFRLSGILVATATLPKRSQKADSTAHDHKGSGIGSWAVMPASFPEETDRSRKAKVARAKAEQP